MAYRHRMRAEDRDRRATSFGSVADCYERARPGYPAEAVRWLAGDRPTRVLDLGAGTGKLTRLLAGAGHDVTAVDPSHRMLEQLRATTPGVDVLLGSAEDIPADDASFDVVVVAQAFHWFDAEAAAAEIARVLKPRGQLGLVWNLRDESTAWVKDVWSVIAPDEPRLIVHAKLPAASPFGPFERATFEHSETVDRDKLLDLALSRSYVASKPRDRQAELLEQAARVFDRHTQSEAALPYVTHCYRAERMARRAARVILLNSHGRALLLKFDPGDGRPAFWLTPGGGLDPGENLVMGAARELYEETGIRVDPAALGAPVAFCTGHADLGWASGLFRDDYFALMTDERAVSPAAMTPAEREQLAEIRWWTPEEIEVTSERVVPNGLPEVVRQVMRGHRPEAPIELPWR